MRFRAFLTLVIALPIVIYSCKNETNTEATEKVETSETVIYNEPFRPQFHFSPREKWMNDPNGLVYHKGVYHLFYQYYPEDIVWGPMHWGHAVSRDLISWEHKPVALYPDELGLIFSGSAVVDAMNSSGLGTTENPPLVAVYTYHSMEGEKAGRTDYQTQGLAYSLDNGDSWEKYKGNPIIGNAGMKDFRDPKVFWNEEKNEWVLVLVAGDHARFYRSNNLLSWELMSEFGRNAGAHGGVWECPDLFKLNVAGSSEEKWVLLISINPGAPNGGSGTQYFVGDFDGETFTSDQKDTKWLDWGMDNYAGVTYNNTPMADRIFIGWMSNWNYARDTPTEVWRSAMTLPRTLELYREGGEYFLKNYPLPAFNKIAAEIIATEKQVSLQYPYTLEHDSLNTTDISFKTDLSKNLSVTISNAKGEQLRLLLNGETGELLFDRTRSGIVNFEKSFGEALQKQPFKPKEGMVEVRLILDQSSIEVFIEDGKYVFTNQLFPRQPYTKLEISGLKDEVIKDLKVTYVGSVWQP
jgi:fructan beta-fructosidase